MRHFGIKFLSADGLSPYACYRWPRVGKWTPKRRRLRVCRTGWHLATLNRAGVDEWGTIGTAFLAEGKGKSLSYSWDRSKVCFEQARLIARLGDIKLVHTKYRGSYQRGLWSVLKRAKAMVAEINGAGARRGRKSPAPRRRRGGATPRGRGSSTSRRSGRRPAPR